MSTSNFPTIRDQVREAATNMAYEAAERQHYRNYQRLEVFRDGTLAWLEAHDTNTATIDREAKDFRAVPALAKVGTGGCACNCDFCADSGFASKADAVAAAATEGASEMEDLLISAIEEIEVGYFADEPTPGPAITWINRNGDAEQLAAELFPGHRVAVVVDGDEQFLSAVSYLADKDDVIDMFFGPTYFYGGHRNRTDVIIERRDAACIRFISQESGVA